MDDNLNTFPAPPKKNNKTLLVIIGVVILAAIIGGYIMSKQPKKTEEKKEVVVEKSEPTPTEKPKIEKSTVKIQVINGTGTPGQAGEVVKALEEAGYSADNIKTGNAEEFDNSVTTIEAKVNFEEIISNIKDELESSFDEIKTKSSELDSENEFDVIIVTGGKIFVTATPTKSASPTSSTTPSPTAQPNTSPTPTITVTPTP